MNRNWLNRCWVLDVIWNEIQFLSNAHDTFLDFFTREHQPIVNKKGSRNESLFWVWGIAGKTDVRAKWWVTCCLYASPRYKYRRVIYTMPDYFIGLHGSRWTMLSASRRFGKTAILNLTPTSSGCLTTTRSVESSLRASSVLPLPLCDVFQVAHSRCLTCWYREMKDLSSLNSSYPLFNVVPGKPLVEMPSCSLHVSKKLDAVHDAILDEKPM